MPTFKEKKMLGPLYIVYYVDEKLDFKQNHLYWQSILTLYTY